MPYRLLLLSFLAVGLGCDTADPEQDSEQGWAEVGDYGLTQADIDQYSQECHSGALPTGREVSTVAPFEDGCNLAAYFFRVQESQSVRVRVRTDRPHNFFPEPDSESGSISWWRDVSIVRRDSLCVHTSDGCSEPEDYASVDWEVDLRLNPGLYHIEVQPGRFTDTGERVRDLPLRFKLERDVEWGQH